MPKAVISAAEEESPAQAPVPVTFRPSAAAEEPLAQESAVVTFSGTADTARKRKRSDSLPAAAADEQNEEGEQNKKHKP